MEDKFVLIKNKTIHYRLVGKGKPVVLIHGFGEDGNVWNDFVAGLQDNYKFIIPDLPGSGKSEMFVGENISIEDYADVIKEILDLENLVKTTMIGHSMGGYITLAFAEKYSSLLNGFGLFHSSAFADDDSKIQTRRKTITFIQKNGAYKYLETAIPNLFADRQHPSINKMIKNGKNFTGEALIQYLHAMINRPDRTQILKSFTKPVLFIIGGNDTAIPLQVSLQQCHLPLISQVHILQNAAHMGMLEEKDKSQHIVSSFLQNIYDSAASKSD